MVSVSGKVGPRTSPPIGFVTKAEPLSLQGLPGLTPGHSSSMRVLIVSWEKDAFLLPRLEYAAEMRYIN